MSEPNSTPKVDFHEVFNKLDSEERAAAESQDFRPPSARMTDQNSMSQGGAATKQHENEYSRMGGLMKAIFPDGIQLSDEEDFASFYLYARVVEHVSRFGLQGMKDHDAIHGAATYSAMLESRIILYR